MSSMVYNTCAWLKLYLEGEKRDQLIVPVLGVKTGSFLFVACFIAISLSLMSSIRGAVIQGSFVCLILKVLTGQDTSIILYIMFNNSIHVPLTVCSSRKLTNQHS